MKHSRIFAAVAVSLLLFFLSASAWAALPKQGVYIKKDEAGRITGHMFITAKQGKGALAAAANDLSVTLEAVDPQGKVTEQLVSDYVEKISGVSGVGMEGFRLTGENLRHSRTAAPDHPRFSPERFSVAWGRHVEYDLRGPDRVAARGCGGSLDGTYIYDGSRENYVTLPALIFTYEKTYCRNQYENRHASAGWYALERDPGASLYPRGTNYILRVNNPPRDDHRNLITDHRIHIVMETRGTDSHFLFIGNDYAPPWTDSAWQDFAGSELTDVNALFLHRYLSLNAPELLEDTNTFFRQAGLHKGKGPVSIWETAILRPDGSGETKLGTALVNSEAGVELVKGDGPVIIKDLNKKTKKKKKR